jgi:hypothetical protein
MLDAGLVLLVSTLAVCYLAVEWYRHAPPRAREDALPMLPVYALYCDECGNRLQRGVCPICEEGIR